MTKPRTSGRIDKAKSETACSVTIDVVNVGSPFNCLPIVSVARSRIAFANSAFVWNWLKRTIAPTSRSESAMPASSTALATSLKMAGIMRAKKSP